MESFLYYLLRTAIVTIFLYGFYKLLFSKTTFYSINRIALIFVLTAIIVLPFSRFQLLPETKKEVIPIEFNTIEQTSLPVMEQTSRFIIDMQWMQLLCGIYFVGLSFFLIRYIIGTLQLIIMIRKSDVHTFEGKSVLCITNKQIEPFSWWKYIVITQFDYSVTNKAIIEHEKAHVELNHSADRLFFDLFTCIFWFNPFLWLLRRELQSVHEFQADEKVINNGIDAKKYQLLLIRKSVGEVKFALANNLLQRDLHKRISMMMKNKTNSSLRWSYGIVLPVLAMIMVVLSIPKLNASESAQQIIEKTVESVTDEPIAFTEDTVVISIQTPELKKEQVANKDTVKIFVDPSLNENRDSVKVSGHGKMNGKNPIEIKRTTGTKNGKEPLYIVDDVEMENGIGDLNPDDIESISVLKESAYGIFGEKGKNGVVIIKTKNKEKKNTLKTKELLIIVDDKEMPADFDINSINPADIESVSVLKDKSAYEIYGEKGKKGVIIIKKKIKEVE